MGFESPSQPTPEELAAMQKERILSDAKLINEGADVGAEGIIHVTEDQKKEAKIEMGEDFYNRSKGLKEENERLKEDLRQERNDGKVWWQKEYKGYDMPRYIDYAAAEEYLKTATAEEVAQLQGLRHQKFRAAEQAHLTPAQEQALSYLGAKEQLDKYLAEGGE